MTLSDRKTILVLGTNWGQADLIRFMKEEGWRVEACAHIAGFPGDADADAFHLLDICDIDSVTELAVNIGADAVYSVSSDVAMTSAVAVAEKLNLPRFYSSEFVDLCNKKQAMREFLNTHDLGKVEFYAVSSHSYTEDRTCFPCMVKPADAQGQRGIFKVDHAKDLSDAIKQACALSPTGIAIVEDYLDGVEISCNILVRDGIFLFDIVSERLAHDGDLTGIVYAHVVPCKNVSDDHIEEARQLSRRTTQALGIKNGCLYFQMKVTENGVRIIEIAPRLDGCHMWRLIKHATGKDYLASTARCLLNLPDNTPEETIVRGDYELFFWQDIPNKLFNASRYSVLPGTEYHEFRYAEGEIIRPINGKIDVTGYYVRPCGTETLSPRHLNKEINA